MTTRPYVPGDLRTVEKLTAEVAAANYRQLAPDTTATSGLSEMLSLSGFAYVMFGENYCSGVPFPAEGQTSAPPIATSEIFNQAVVRFDRSIANFGGDNNRLWMALVGKARALLDLNQPAAAAARAVSMVDQLKP